MGERRPSPAASKFSRRERQVMDVIYRLGKASVQEVREGIAEPPSYSAVRALMNVLADKGHLARHRAGRKFHYRPTVAPSRARRSAMKSLIETFFDGSVESAVSALLDLRSRSLDAEVLDRLEERIAQVRRKEEDTEEDREEE